MGYIENLRNHFNKGTGTGTTTDPFVQAFAADAAGAKATYSAWNTALDYAAYATPTDMVGLVNPAGSGKVIKVISAQFNPRSTSATLETWLLVKRSTLNTGGALAAAPAIMPLDSNDAAAVGLVNVYTAAPTLGTLAGTAFGSTVSTSALTASPTNVSIFSAASPPLPSLTAQQKFVTLRPGESLYWNFNGAALPSGFAAGWSFQWTEE